MKIIISFQNLLTKYILTDLCRRSFLVQEVLIFSLIVCSSSTCLYAAAVQPFIPELTVPVGQNSHRIGNHFSVDEVTGKKF